MQSYADKADNPEDVLGAMKGNKTHVKKQAFVMFLVKTEQHDFPIYVKASPDGALQNHDMCRYRKSAGPG